MELLIESYTAAEANMITESLNNHKDMYLSGIFMESEIRNRNGRMYKKTEMAKAVDSLNETIRIHGGVIGEIDHPTNRLTSELKYASHLITEVRMDGNKGVGKMKLLDTPSGIIVKECIKAGYRPGVSTRGAGNVDSDGVVENFAIQTVDIVVVQSAPNALPETVYESLENLKSGRKALTLAEAVREDPKAQKHLEKAILSFIDEITKFKK
jgi:hypothetical protein